MWLSEGLREDFIRLGGKEEDWNSDGCPSNPVEWNVEYRKNNNSVGKKLFFILLDTAGKDSHAYSSLESPYEVCHWKFFLSCSDTAVYLMPFNLCLQNLLLYVRPLCIKKLWMIKTNYNVTKWQVKYRV